MLRLCLLFRFGVALSAVAIGCAGNSPPVKKWSEGDARLGAALAITDSHQKDDALVKIAADAAVAGDAEIVKKAVKNIGDKHEKDNAAAASAVKLAKAGDASGATEVAQMISDKHQRDNTLSQLAKGVKSD